MVATHGVESQFHDTSGESPSRPISAAGKASFRSSSGGIALFLTATLACLGVAGMCFVDAATANVLLLAVTLIAVTGGIVAIGLSIEEHPQVALALILSLPVVGGVFFAGLQIAIGRPVIGVFALVLALVFAVFWIRSRGSRIGA